MQLAPCMVSTQGMPQDRQAHNSKHFNRTFNSVVYGRKIKLKLLSQQQCGALLGTGRKVHSCQTHLG